MEAAGGQRGCFWFMYFIYIFDLDCTPEVHVTTNMASGVGGVMEWKDRCNVTHGIDSSVTPTVTSSLWLPKDSLMAYCILHQRTFHIRDQFSKHVNNRNGIVNSLYWDIQNVYHLDYVDWPVGYNVTFHWETDCQYKILPSGPWDMRRI